MFDAGCLQTGSFTHIASRSIASTAANLGPTCSCCCLLLPSVEHEFELTRWLTIIQEEDGGCRTDGAVLPEERRQGCQLSPSGLLEASSRGPGREKEGRPCFCRQPIASWSSYHCTNEWKRRERERRICTMLAFAGSLPTSLVLSGDQNRQ